MLDLAQVVTKGGIVLWSREFADIPSSDSHPVNALIADVLVEERAGLEHYDKDFFRVQWAFANDLGLIFVVVYQKILQLTYIEELLELMKKSFVDMFVDTIKDTSALHTYDFDDAFDIILSTLESKAASEKKMRAPRKFQDSKKFANTLESSKQDPSKLEKNSEDSAPSSPSMDIATKIKQLQMSKNGKKSPSKKDEPDQKKKKILRSWNGSQPQDGGKQIDFSDSREDAQVNADLLVDRNAMGQRTSDGLYEAAEMDDVELPDDEDLEVVKASTTKDKAKPSGLFGFIQSFTSGRSLSEENLEPVLAKMKEHLISKNVASEISETLCNSVRSSLVGQKHGTFQSMSSTVKTAMEAALRKILTPRTSTDILRDVLSARAEGRPYSFVFVGVNGVGKSTNLSKICFWLLQNNLKVLIAACDTFRSGAVEQLRVHVRNLTALESGAVVDIYERGYGKDSATIAKDAISYAKQNKYDVVLVDTAGRMQDNEPLMRALAKLVAINTPDKIIFVGEALVGNESVDQLTKFNQALRDFSGMANPRQVDGIVLSKFDTVDDKVGAAISMTYITGKPILFVGTGQTYTDLKRMNVRSIVATLLA
ncbi:hypothetical protein HDU97_009450 [Phlyctochytrium planicorne]|nr:hypothetical protein HDU97_009450 [Phlyctochytrium planicorne]